jgi:hypothetical protein
VLACYRGQFLALEIKRLGQEPTALQCAVIEQIHGAGGVAEIVHGLAEVRQILLEIDEELGLQRFGE